MNSRITAITKLPRFLHTF